MFDIRLIDFEKIKNFFNDNLISFGINSVGNVKGALSEAIQKYVQNLWINDNSHIYSDFELSLFRNADKISELIIYYLPPETLEDWNNFIKLAGDLINQVWFVLNLFFRYDEDPETNPILNITDKKRELTQEEIEFNKNLYESEGYKVDETGHVEIIPITPIETINNIDETTIISNDNNDIKMEQATIVNETPIDEPIDEPIKPGKPINVIPETPIDEPRPQAPINTAPQKPQAPGNTETSLNNIPKEYLIIGALLLGYLMLKD